VLRVSENKTRQHSYTENGFQGFQGATPRMAKVNFFNINEEEVRRQYGAASEPGNPSAEGRTLPKKLCRRG
jgi:hypothetical protein